MNAVKNILLLLCASMLLPGCLNSTAEFALGTLERERIELIANHTEEITAILVKEGETVRKGQKLLQLDMRISQAQLAAISAQREQAAARLAELERGPRPERIAEAQAMLARSDSLLIEARQSLTRVKSLVAKKLASAAELDQSQAKYKAAVASLKADQARLSSLQHGSTVEELAQARQAFLQAQANAERQQLLLNKLSINAPRNGVIDSLLYKQGEQALAGSVVAVMLADTAPFARVYIPQPYRTRVSSGSKMRVHIEGVEQILTGQVRLISSDPSFTPYYSLTERDRSRLSYLAEIDLNAEEARLLPTGLPVQVELPEPAGNQHSSSAPAGQ